MRPLRVTVAETLEIEDMLVDDKLELDDGDKLVRDDCAELEFTELVGV
jgi:hypothetical protein